MFRIWNNACKLKWATPAKWTRSWWKTQNIRKKNWPKKDKTFFIERQNAEKYANELSRQTSRGTKTFNGKPDNIGEKFLGSVKYNQNENEKQFEATRKLI